MEQKIHKLVKKNFRELRLAEIEHKYIHIDCVIISWIFGAIFGLIVGPYLSEYDPTMPVINLIAFSFAFSSLFWAWRLAVFFRKHWNRQRIKKEIRDSYEDGKK